VDVTVELATSVAGLAGGRAMGARVVDFSSLQDGDVALLKVEQTDLPATPVAATDPNVGAEIVSVGFPATVDLVTDPDLNAAYKDGRISQHRTRDGGTLPVWEISAAMSGGMSGGPTVNLDGEIVGVNSYGIVGEEQQFNFVSPAQLVREIASRNGVSLELDETSQAYRDGVTALHAGNHQAAIDAFDTVLATVPSHSKAADLKRIAERELAQAPPEEEPAQPARGELPDEPVVVPAATTDQGVPVWVWALVAAVVVLVLLIGALGVMLMRQRKPATLPPPHSLARSDNGEPTIDLTQDRDPTGPRQ
jgi:serine protease Do